MYQIYGCHIGSIKLNKYMKVSQYKYYFILYVNTTIMLWLTAYNV